MEANYFIILWWFLPYTDVSQPWVYMCAHPEPPPTSLPTHPSGWSKCSGLECPASCIWCGLVVYFTYGNIHVSMLFSQIILESYETRGLMLQCLVKGMVWHGTVTGDQPQHIFCPSSIICKGMAKLPHIEFRIIYDSLISRHGFGYSFSTL